MSKYLSTRDIDWTVLLIVLLICAVGVLQIYSATRDTDYTSAWWKQIIYVAGGLFLMWLMMAVDYHSMLHYVPALYIGSVAALVITYVIGERTYGSKRWIPVGFGIHLQVSEFVKLVIILLVARYLTELRTDELEIREMLKLAGLVLVPTALVMKQPDLGTSLTYLAVLIACAFLAGLRWKYVAIIAIVTVVGLPIGWQFLNEYQKGRIVSFMDPERDPQGKGYQLIQSQIAVGSGGIWGMEEPWNSASPRARTPTAAGPSLGKGATSPCRWERRARRRSPGRTCPRYRRASGGRGTARPRPAARA